MQCLLSAKSDIVTHCDELDHRVRVQQPKVSYEPQNFLVYREDLDSEDIEETVLDNNSAISNNILGSGLKDQILYAMLNHNYRDNFNSNELKIPAFRPSKKAPQY